MQSDLDWLCVFYEAYHQFLKIMPTFYVETFIVCVDEGENVSWGLDSQTALLRESDLFA